MGGFQLYRWMPHFLKAEWVCEKGFGTGGDCRAVTMAKTNCSVSSGGKRCTTRCK